jgi:hypothetical protein
MVTQEALKRPYEVQQNLIKLQFERHPLFKAAHSSKATIQNHSERAKHLDRGRTVTGHRNKVTHKRLN